MLRFLAISTVFSISFVACASSSSGLAAAAGAPRGRECRVPDSAPAPATRFLRGSFDFPQSLRTSPPDTLLLIVGYDTTGAFDSLVLSSRTNRQYDLVRDPRLQPPAFAVEFPEFDGRVVYQELREQFVDRAPPAAIGASLLPTSGVANLFPSPAAFDCAPMLTNASGLLQFMDAFARLRATSLQSSRVSTIRLMVEADGHATNARIVRSSGDAEIDTGLLRIAELANFEPPIRYGYPVRTEAAFTFGISRSGSRIAPFDR